jgi:hypothetical protein
MHTTTVQLHTTYHHNDSDSVQGHGHVRALNWIFLRKCATKPTQQSVGGSTDYWSSRNLACIQLPASLNFPEPLPAQPDSGGSTVALARFNEDRRRQRSRTMDAWVHHRVAVAAGTPMCSCIRDVAWVLWHCLYVVLEEYLVCCMSVSV